MLFEIIFFHIFFYYKNLFITSIMRQVLSSDISEMLKLVADVSLFTTSF
jgi:hypothetical protein